jgi:cholesterol transport system auxiliary component
MKTIPKRIFKVLCVTVACHAMVSCSLLGPVKPVEVNKYRIMRVPLDIKKHRRHNAVILVLPPESRPLFNTTQMAYSMWPYQVAYFAQNEWAETPSQMLQPLIVETLTSSHYYKAVVTSGYLGHSDYALYTQILDLYDDFTFTPATLDLTVRAQLVRVDNNQVVATKVISIQEPLVTDKPFSGVVAANMATAEMLRRLTSFSIRNSGAEELEGAG